MESTFWASAVQLRRKVERSKGVRDLAQKIIATTEI